MQCKTGGKGVRCLMIVAILGAMANVPLVQAQSVKPTNPFRNLPAAGDPNANNPFANGQAQEAAPPPPPYEPPPPVDYGGDAYSGGEYTGDMGGSVGSSSGSGGGDAPLKPGEQLILGAKKPQNHAKNQEVVVNFNYPNAEILDVAKAISKLTGRNFIYTPTEVKGRISIISETPIRVEDAWKAFLTALDMKDFTIIPSGEYLRIARAQVAKEKQVPLYAGKYTPDTDEYITRVVPLKYISAKEVENTFRLWIPRQGRLYAHEQTNTLIITDTAAHIKSFLELISLLDVSGFQESLAVIPIRFAAAKDLAKLIEQIIFGTSGSGQKGRVRPVGGFQAPRVGGFGGDTGGGGREGSLSISQIIAEDRTNSLVVKANKPGLEEIRNLVAKLDVKRTVSEGSGRIHVVRLQYADAEELSKALGAIATNKGGTSNLSNRLGGFPGSTASSGPQDSVATLFQGEVKISPDPATQSLVITASAQDFQTLKRVIQQLDIPRDQVFVEAVIMELNLSRSDGFGVSFASPRNGTFFPSDNLKNLLFKGQPGDGLSLGFKRGGNVDLQVGPGQTVSVPGLTALLELLQSTGNSNILARPQLIALDNQEATVTISDEVPVQSTTSSINGIQQSFSKDKASLLLKVKPHINKASDFVRMEVEQKLEEFNDSIGPAETRGKALSKQSRETKTQVVVQNEDTVVISGLIREKQTERLNKVPLLGDIPVLGWLFKNQKMERIKTDLAIFLTPRVVKQYDKVRSVLTERLQERQDYVNDSFAGDDPQAEHVKRLRERLPDITKLSALPSVNATDDSASFAAPSRSSDDDNGNNDNLAPAIDYAAPPPVEMPPPPPAFTDPGAIPPPGGEFDNGGQNF